MDEPTIMPAAFVPWPITLFAVVVLPPSVPRSVTVKVSSPRACVNPMTQRNIAAKLTLFRVFIGNGVLLNEVKLRPTEKSVHEQEQKYFIRSLTSSMRGILRARR